MTGGMLNHRHTPTPSENQSDGASLQLLGGLSVQVRGVDLTPAIRGRVGQLAFAYLTIHRHRAVRRDELAAAIWEQNAPAEPDAALRVVLSRLRKALGSEALVGRAEIRLVLPEPAEVDLEQLRGLVDHVEQSDDPQQARSAVVEASRILLPGLEADWLRRERDELLQLRIRALRRLGETALKAGGSELYRAEEAGRALIAAAPFQEAGHRLRIEALAARGELAQSLTAYEELRILLRDELGIVPSRGMSELHMELLLGADEASRPSDRLTSRQLPLPAVALHRGGPRFAGRIDELHRLGGAWLSARNGQPRCVLMAGEAGIGKSRLASEFAQRVHAHGANVLWGNCRQQALVPYEPVVEALRQYTSVLDDAALAELAHLAGGEFVSIAPELGQRLPGAIQAPTVDDPQARRSRLLESVAEVLTILARERPLVLVLEDLHWCGQTTARLLSHVLACPSVSPILVLGTLRGVDHPLSRSLVAADCAEVMELGRLDGPASEPIIELARHRDHTERRWAQTKGNCATGPGVSHAGRVVVAPGAVQHTSQACDRPLLRLGNVARTAAASAVSYVSTSNFILYASAD